MWSPISARLRSLRQLLSKGKQAVVGTSYSPRDAGDIKQGLARAESSRPPQDAEDAFVGELMQIPKHGSALEVKARSWASGDVTSGECGMYNAWQGATEAMWAARDALCAIAPNGGVHDLAREESRYPL